MTGTRQLDPGSSALARSHAAAALALAGCSGDSPPSDGDRDPTTESFDKLPPADLARAPVAATH
jgi:hypothetical protein